MNAILSVIKNNKAIFVANDGRLLKKCLLGFLILSFAFQSNNLGDIVRNVLVEAYLQVSVFVGFTLFVFIGIDSLTKFNVENFLNKTKTFHVPIATILGALPGCGGAIIVVTQFIQGRISFGALVAVLTATMGDAAFLLLSKEPSTGILVFAITCATGIVTGYFVDFFHNHKFQELKQNFKIEFEKIGNTFVSRFNIFWVIIFVPGFSVGLLTALRVNLDNYFLISNFNLVESIGSIGAIISIFMWTLNPLSDFQCSTEKTRSFLSRVIDTTNFVTTWVVCGFLFFELLIYFSDIDLMAFFNVWIAFVPLIAILFGFIPGCGPQIIVTTFYLNGYIPLSAELGNAISNDGDALFPAIALAPKSAILATLYSGIPAVIVAYSYMLLFEI